MPYSCAWQTSRRPQQILTAPGVFARQAWLALLALPLPADAYRRVLVRMHDLIIPHLTSPLLLADFLTASLNRGAHFLSPTERQFCLIQSERVHIVIKERHHR
jgi:hypothetical protein